MQEKVNEEDVGIKARSVLWYLTFIGFAMNYMIRININIAIVDMISPEYKSKAVTSSECFSTNITMSKNESLMLDHSERYVSFEKRILDYFGVSCVNWIAIMIIKQTRWLIFRSVMECDKLVWNKSSMTKTHLILLCACTVPKEFLECQLSNKIFILISLLNAHRSMFISCSFMDIHGIKMNFIIFYYIEL